MPLLNVFSIIGTYPYTENLRIVFINTVVSKPGKHELYFQLYKFDEEFNCRLDSKMPDTSRSRILVDRFPIGNVKVKII